MNPKFKDIGAIEDRVIEELGELIQAISKARRFGYNNFHPATMVSNIDAIYSEISDVDARLVEYRMWLSSARKALEETK